jgi:hypothetical protein
LLLSARVLSNRTVIPGLITVGHLIGSAALEKLMLNANCRLNKAEARLTGILFTNWAVATVRYRKNEMKSPKLKGRRKGGAKGEGYEGVLSTCWRSAQRMRDVG